LFFFFFAAQKKNPKTHIDNLDPKILVVIFEMW